MAKSLLALAVGFANDNITTPVPIAMDKTGPAIQALATREIKAWELAIP